MMGLLDILNTDEGRMGMGLLAAAGPRSDGAGFGQRLQEGMGSFDAYKQNALKQKMLEAQMQEWQQKTAREKMLNDLAMKKQAALPSLFTGGQQGLAPLAGDASTGILPSQGRDAVPGRLDVQRALAAGYSPDEIAKLDSLRNVGMDEVARTVKGMQNGREVEQQYDKFGRPVGQGMEQYRAPIEMATGAQKILLNPYTQKPMQSFAMEQSPDSRASTAATIRGQNLTDARAKDSNGKAPSGYVWGPAGADGVPTLIAAKGGPADLKMVGALNQDTQALTGSVSSMDRMAAAANEVLNHPGLNGIAGIRGAIPNIPGSDAANAQALLGTLKSQVGFGVLQDMRNNSKTGGALGSVSDAEGKRLESNLAALDKSQSAEQLRANLQKIIDYTEGAKGRLREAYGLKHGQGSANPAPFAQPAASTKSGATVSNW